MIPGIIPGICSKFYLISVIHSRSDRSINTHMCHHSAYNQRIHPKRLQMIIQFGFQETVREMFDYDLVSALGFDPVGYFHAMRAFQEEVIIRRVYVLNIYDRPAARSAFGNQFNNASFIVLCSKIVKIIHHQCQHF